MIKNWVQKKMYSLNLCEDIETFIVDNLKTNKIISYIWVFVIMFFSNNVVVNPKRFTVSFQENFTGDPP